MKTTKSLARLLAAAVACCTLFLAQKSRAYYHTCDAFVTADHHRAVGEVSQATVPMAKANPVQFSTKGQNDETDLFFYGFRFYSPSAGRWLSRDPIEERGGQHLYGFVRNDPTDFSDLLGLVVQHIEYRAGNISDAGLMEPVDKQGCNYDVKKCAGGGCTAYKYKITNVRCNANVIIYFRIGLNPDRPQSGTVFTLRDHELRHAKNLLDYINSFEEALGSVKEQCRSQVCISAMQDWIKASTDLSHAIMRRDDEQVHVLDYRGLKDLDYAEAVKLYGYWNGKVTSLFTEYFRTQKAMQAQCAK